MTEHTAFVVFLLVACGGLALFTVTALVIAGALWTRNRRTRR